MVFSLIPPTGNTWAMKIIMHNCHYIENTFPVRDISPVIASCCLTGLPIASESNADTIVQPADGPSLGVAPYNV